MSRTHNAIWRIKSHWLNKIDIGTPFLMPKYYVSQGADVKECPCLLC